MPDEIPIGIGTDKKIITFPIIKKEPIIAIIGKNRMGRSMFAHQLSGYYKYWNKE